MSTSPRHLLNMPREIRNRIYHYLSHEITFNWRWNHWPLAGNEGISKVCLKDAPRLSVLLTSHRLYEEYSESEHFKNTAITIDLAGASRNRKDNRAPKFEDQFVCRVTRVDIFVDMGGNKISERQRWMEIFLLGRALVAYSPCLAAVEIRAQNSEELLDGLPKQPQTYTLMDGHCGHFRLPCESVAGLDLLSCTRVFSHCEKELSVRSGADSGVLVRARSGAERQDPTVPMVVWLYTKKDNAELCLAHIQEIVADA
jgi:hypothetical protein